MDAWLTRRAPDGRCEALAWRSGKAARLFWEKAINAADWPLDTPSVTSHILLACGHECDSPGNPDGLVDAWFLGGLNEPEAPLLHRGELSALAAELGLRRSKPIMWSSDEVTTVGEWVDQMATEFAVPPKQPWDGREVEKGPVYGWELQAICTFYDPDDVLPNGLRVSEAALAVAQAGPNLATEAGAHDLEGLALCLAEQRAQPHTGDPDAWAQIQAVLDEHLQSDLESMTSSGQIYDGLDGFSTCGAGDPLCEPMEELVRQAHFIEWSTLIQPTCTPSYARALQRFAELNEELSEGPDIWAEGRTQAMLLLAATHSMHGVRRLAWLYDER